MADDNARLILHPERKLEDTPVLSTPTEPPPESDQLRVWNNIREIQLRNAASLAKDPRPWDNESVSTYGSIGSTESFSLLLDRTARMMRPDLFDDDGKLMKPEPADLLQQNVTPAATSAPEPAAEPVSDTVSEPPHLLQPTVHPTMPSPAEARAAVAYAARTPGAVISIDALRVQFSNKYSDEDLLFQLDMILGISSKKA